MDCVLSWTYQLLHLKQRINNASQSKKGKYSNRLPDTEQVGRHGSFRTQDSFYRMLVESLDEYAVFTVDKIGTISSWSRGAEDMLGYGEEEVIGKNALFTFTIEDQKSLALGKMLKQTLKGHRMVNERFHVKKDGSKFWATGFVFLLEDESRIPRGFTFVLRDQTEQKMLEKRKDDFISTATHELKTPLTSMKLFVEVVRLHAQRTGDRVSLQSVEQLNKQLDRLTSLMDYLLDVSKIQQGSLRLDKTYFNINKLIEELIFTLQIVAPKHMILQRGGAEDLIFADKERIIQVLTNLLTNAIKYSPNGGEIKVSSIQDSHGAIISIQDSGLGISLAEQGHIFDRFYRASSATNNNIGGIGLGLYIAEKIIEAHRGKIWVSSARGKGSTFSFSLPKKHEKELTRR